MDIRMNDMDGIAATIEIKNEFPDARIVIITDYDDPDFRRSAQAAGARGYASKRDLLAVRRILSTEEREPEKSSL